MILCPIFIRQANAFVSLHHRHNKPTRGALFAISCSHMGRMVGVGIVGRPVSREIKREGTTCEVLRVATSSDAPKGACSWIYARCKRAAATLGYRKVITYTLVSEGGASLRALGATPIACGRPHQWTKRADGDNRINQDVCGQEKIRWEMAV